MNITFTDLDCGRIVLTLDVDRIRADFIVSADDVEDPMDLGCGSGTVGARWHNWQCEESEGSARAPLTRVVPRPPCHLL
jgi:hypothetical protein